MECPIGADAAPTVSPPSGTREDAGAHALEVQPELRCVWTGDPASGCSCTSSVPEHLVIAAWRRELERFDVLADRFFRFTWQNSVWLAYGLVDGGVRGVHCPPHRAEREQRTVAAGSRIDEHADAFALYA
jgi:hypothetical protein